MASGRYLVVTLWALPFAGGAESYMRDTLEWASSAGWWSAWLSFANTSNMPHTKFCVHREKLVCGADAIRVDVPCGLDVNHLRQWLRLLQPDVVHHQGHSREVVLAACRAERIPVLTGYHFWIGAVVLHDQLENVRIRENLEKHKLDSSLTQVLAAKDVVPYVASEFMSEVLSALGCKRRLMVLSPCPRQPSAVPYFPEKRRFVTQINLHRGKGGHVFLELLRDLPDIPFLGVLTEGASEDLDRKIREQAGRCAEVDLRGWTSAIDDIYEQTRILLLPSVVDETYCRVAAEGMQRGIPILCSGAGNLRHLCAKAQTVQDGAWSRRVKEMYGDFERLRRESRCSLEHAPSEIHARGAFLQAVQKVLAKSRRMNVMLFAPWADQGLGMQAKTYVRLLREIGATPYVFSYLPYFSKTVGDRHQADPEEWRDGCVTYSPHIREKVTDVELQKFVDDHEIGTCIIPETCWGRVFEIARSLTGWGVRCCAVPNIEIVVRAEVDEHRVFWRILCNNRLCMDKFEEFGFPNCHYVGYAIPEPHPRCRTSDLDGPLRFLCIGGMNAIIRKQVHLVCEAFAGLDENLRLTATSQSGDAATLSKYAGNSRIRLVTSHLTWVEVDALYETHDVVVLVSSHEGLGIGFYEALAHGKPVVTLDAPPFSEIVHADVNGWTVPCTHRPLRDNLNGVIDAVDFDPADLAKVVQGLARNRDRVAQVTHRLVADYNDRFTWSRFRARFATAIGLRSMH